MRNTEYLKLRSQERRAVVKARLRGRSPEKIAEAEARKTRSLKRKILPGRERGR